MHCLHCELIIFPKKYYIHTGSAFDWAPFKIQFRPDGRTGSSTMQHCIKSGVNGAGWQSICMRHSRIRIYIHTHRVGSSADASRTHVRSFTLAHCTRCCWLTNTRDRYQHYTLDSLTNTHSPDEMHVPRKLTRKSPKSTKQTFYI